MPKKEETKKTKKNVRSDGRIQMSFRHKGKRHYVYGATRTECKEKLEAKRAEMRAGEYVPSNRITVAQFVAEWLGDVKKLSYRVRSYKHRDNALRNHIAPFFGAILLQKVELRMVQRWIAQMSEVGLAPSTIHGHFHILAASFDYAMIVGIIKSNPCQHAILPPIVKIERPVLDASQIAVLHARLAGHWLAPVVRFALFTGMREGELIGLKWSDIDLEARSIQVRRTVSYVAGEGHVEGPCKTDSSTRRIGISPLAAKMLEDHRHQQKLQEVAALEWQYRDLVFPNASGGYLLDRTIDKVIYRLREKGILPTNFTFHCLRHTVAALLIKEGVQPKLIQELMGHSSIQVTMDLYGHLFPGMAEEAIGKLDSVYNKMMA